MSCLWVDLTPLPHVWYHGTCHRVVGHCPQIGRSSNMVMEYMNRRTRRRQRTDTDVRSTSSIEVISMIRTQPFTWLVIAEYNYGTGTWVESVTFQVTLDHGTIPATRLVRVHDTDFEGDRSLTLTVDRGDTRTMPQVILDFILAGRW